MNIAAYCRVSTDKEDQLNSLEAQKEFFSEYTKRTGDNLVRLYADEGISGTKIKNRKEFLRMMSDAEHGLFDMVVVKDISRFARNTVDLLQNVRKLKALGIETQFLTANMTSMGNSEFVLTIFGALAQEESANTSKRVKFGKKMNAEKGRVPNIVYGYDKTIGDYFNLAINEEEAAVVRQIYQWYIKDGYGAAKISIFLNERGLRTKRNCQWSQNGVCRILTNELYTGKIINGKQEVTDFLTGQRADKDASEWMVVDRPDLRIIDPETFEQAQQIMKSRGKAFKVDKERQSNKYLFSTLIKCKECGWSFRRTVRTYKNTYVRWVCSGHNGRGADNCPNAVTVDEDELIKVLQEYFAGLLKAKKNVIRYVVGEFQRVYKAKDENLNYEKELTAQLAKLQKTRQKYMDMYADDLISREELNDKIGGMRKEIERLENELKMVSYHLTKGEQLESVLGQTFKEIEDITDVRQMTNAQLKRIIQKIEVDKDGNVDIYLRLLGDLGLDETVLIRNDETDGGIADSTKGVTTPVTTNNIVSANNSTHFTVQTGEVTPPTPPTSGGGSDDTRWPNILQHPQSVSAPAGSLATFSVVANGGPLSYQWQVDRRDGKGFVSIPGATGATLTVGPVTGAENGYQYRCAVTLYGATMYSGAGQLFVTAGMIPKTGDMPGSPALLLALAGLGLAAWVVARRRAG